MTRSTRGRLKHRKPATTGALKFLAETMWRAHTLLVNSIGDGCARMDASLLRKQLELRAPGLVTDWVRVDQLESAKNTPERSRVDQLQRQSECGRGCRAD
jgi:hypothetical protein